MDRTSVQRRLDGAFSTERIEQSFLVQRELDGAFSTERKRIGRRFSA